MGEKLQGENSYFDRLSMSGIRSCGRRGGGAWRNPSLTLPLRRGEDDYTSRIITLAMLMRLVLLKIWNGMT